MENAALVQISETQWTWADNELAQMAKKEFEENLFCSESETISNMLAEMLHKALRMLPEENADTGLLAEVIAKTCQKLAQDRQKCWEFVNGIIEPGSSEVSYDWTTATFTVKPAATD